MFKRLSQGIAKTRASLVSGIKSLTNTHEGLSDDDTEALETSLLMADCGVEATTELIEATNARLKKNGGSVLETVKTEVASLLSAVDRPAPIEKAGGLPYVILVVGVNGAGKTTSIAKMGQHLQNRGLKVMFAAGDTFRAAAVEQLKMWGERLGVPVIAQHTGADPASVIFDACAAAKSREFDVLIADTAGRLQTQTNLMNELEKIKRVIAKHDPSAPHETILVIDATMGQNAISQAELFDKQIGLDSLLITKLDGTSKGGIVIALAKKFARPIRYVGVGEGPDDLQIFDAADFAAALFDEN
ncbi:MAG: signal recognition particle-docking protein FtsY [Gammaproteobacteria bacterium]